MIAWICHTKNMEITQDCQHDELLNLVKIVITLKYNFDFKPLKMNFK